MTPESAVINQPSFISGSKCSSFVQHNQILKCSIKFSSKSNHFPCRVVSSCFNPSIFGGIYSLRLRRHGIVGGRAHLRSLSEENNDLGGDQGEVLGLNLKSLKILLKQGVFIWAMLCCLLFFACKRVLAAEGLVNAGYGVIKVAIFHLTGITPKSIAVHNPKEGAGYVDMIETVLEIKDTHVREVMTPLVDVVATDASATLVDFNHPWVTHQYSRVPVFEQRVDNIVGLAYAMDVLDFARKGEQLESSTMGDMAHKPAYFVPGNP
ncbi:hypothetical protein SLE2022_336470 [Rubroshorea leprosula]